MVELIHRYTVEVKDASGIAYQVYACGKRRADGRWEGWLEFCPVNDTGPTLRTERETTQPDKPALAYWASGLEPLYFEGAFERAKHVMERRRLQTVEEYVLELFRTRGRARLLANEIFESTAEYPPVELAKAFEDMEKNKRLVVRYQQNNDDWVQLIPEGPSYAG